jgi:DNA invertase Pin-like site-specific DNA recombinase
MIVGYIRVSTEKQHPENQRDEINRYAAGNEWAVDKWVVEVVSGKTRVKGRKLDGLLRRMKKGDTLIVTEISRLSRSLTDIMGLMGKCMSKGINIYTIKEKYCFDDSINSKVLCFAFGLVAEIERNLISMRTKEALALRKAEGKQLGRKEGFCPKMEVLMNNEDEIRKMLSAGMSNKDIYTSYNVSKSTFTKFKNFLMQNRGI